MRINIPNPCVVVLIGPSGCGKSTFARKHFLPSEILSSDAFRAIVSDDENNMEATSDAFALLEETLRVRLKNGRLCVIDATNVQESSRKGLIEAARAHFLFAIAIVFDLPEKVCQERNVQRKDRDFGSHVIRNHIRDMKRSMRNLKREFRFQYVLDSEEAVNSVEIVRETLYSDRRDLQGPFDIIGDVHGCNEELGELLSKLGYPDDPESPEWPARTPVFLGDLVDRGPSSVGVLRRVMGLVKAGKAICVPGNHDIKLMRKLDGREVQMRHGLQMTWDELERETDEFKTEVGKFIFSLVSHYVLDQGKLVVAHAGMIEQMQGRSAGPVRDFALYGETTGEIDEYGMPVRYNWASDYKGRARVVYGHTPVMAAEWFNRTIDVDTGCVFGGSLTALRYPEMELVSVPAKKVYFESIKPLNAVTIQPEPADDVLDLEDIQGKRVIETAFSKKVVIREENAMAALEAISRFAIAPNLLIYLPPTMSPSETSNRPDFLEHPEDALAYYAANDVKQVVCQEKHMGSRAVVLVGKSAAAIEKRFDTSEGSTGIITSRTGRRFFDDLSLESFLLDRLRGAADRSGLWDELKTDWMLLDAELMPWSAKAHDLLQKQYVPVGQSAQASLSAAMSYLDQTRLRGIDGEPFQSLFEQTKKRREAADRYVEAYRRYSWPTPSPEDFRLAPFHLLATEGVVHTDKTHAWHLDCLTRLCNEGGPVLFTTRHRFVNLEDASSREAAIDWWLEMTGNGGEGMVVKPETFIARGKHGLLQPAVKCRGREYLRIIYGPEYLLPENLERLRKRGLNRKRGLAMQEFCLGIEGLRRFVDNESIRSVHECVFGILALESEPVDPRL